MPDNWTEQDYEDYRIGFGGNETPRRPGVRQGGKRVYDEWFQDKHENWWKTDPKTGEYVLGEDGERIQGRERDGEIVPSSEINLPNPSDSQRIREEMEERRERLGASLYDSAMADTDEALPEVSDEGESAIPYSESDMENGPVGAGLIQVNSKDVPYYDLSSDEDFGRMIALNDVRDMDENELETLWGKVQSGNRFPGAGQARAWLSTRLADARDKR